MRVTARTHTIAMVLYSLPFLAVFAFSLFFVWAGTLEMIVAAAALVPAVLHVLGVRWCRYVVGVIAAMAFVVCCLRAIPALRSLPGPKSRAAHA